MSLQPITAAPLLTLDRLSPLEDLILGKLRGIWSRAQPKNLIKQQAYEAKRLAPSLGIAVPPQFRDIETVVGWPGTVVDVLEERLDLESWEAKGDSSDLDEMFAANRMRLKSGMANLDALIHGISFVFVGAGDSDVGEADPLITVESPLRATVLVDHRTGWVSAAAVFDVQVDPWLGQWAGPRTTTLMLPDQTITIESDPFSKSGTVVNRDQHNLGRVTVARIANRVRSSDPYGRSEITRPILSYTDHAVRTLLGMDIAREFYSAPQRYILGADESAFQDAEGNPKSAWETYMGRVLALTRDENGELPQVGTFTAGSPLPYLEQIRGLAQLVSAEAGIATTALGFSTDNPASGDGIRMAETRQDKRAWRRTVGFGDGYSEAAQMGLWVRDGKVSAPRGITSQWRDPGTPTRAAMADAAVKLTQGDKPLLPVGPVAWRKAGLTDQEIKQVEEENRQGGVGRSLTSITSAAEQIRTSDPQVAQLVSRQVAGDIPS